jgi:transcriptional regulator of arginine metabolism
VSTMTAERRRRAVVRILQGERISTQGELLGALRREGLRATQATLSRDLSRLGVRRASRPGGGTFYELGDGAAEVDAALSGLVASVAANGSTVVVRTRPGSAPTVARAIDLASLPEVLGTIAGDDTIFVAPATARRARAVASKLSLWFGVSPSARRPGTRERSPWGRAEAAGARSADAPTGRPGRRRRDRLPRLRASRATPADSA